MNFSDLISPTTLNEVKQGLLDSAEAAALKVTSWIKGGPAEHLITLISKGIFAATGLNTYAIRAQFIGLATDPGDPGDPDTVEGVGWLTAKGEGDYGTPRIQKTFATGFVTLTNSSGGPYVFGPDELTVQSNAGDQPTYRNVDDATIYTPTYTLLAATSVVIPVQAELLGTVGNAAPGDVDILVTTLPGVTVTNAAAIVGTDRESAESYRAKCRNAAAATSPNGPADAYRYIATTAREDGTFGNQESDAVALSISRVYVTPDSDENTVDVWYASAAGAASAPDFAIVDALVTQYAVPATVNYTGHIATETIIAVTYTVRCTAASGLITATVTDAVEEALADFMSAVPVSGYDIVAGVGGVVYDEIIKAVIGKAHPSIFKVDMTVPAADTALAIGAVPVLGAVAGIVVFV